MIHPPRDPAVLGAAVVTRDGRVMSINVWPMHRALSTHVDMCKMHAKQMGGIVRLVVLGDVVPFTIQGPNGPEPEPEPETEQETAA